MSLPLGGPWGVGRNLRVAPIEPCQRAAPIGEPGGRRCHSRLVAGDLTAESCKDRRLLLLLFVVVLLFLLLAVVIVLLLLLLLPPPPRPRLRCGRGHAFSHAVGFTGHRPCAQRVRLRRRLQPPRPPRVEARVVREALGIWLGLAAEADHLPPATPLASRTSRPAHTVATPTPHTDPVCDITRFRVFRRNLRVIETNPKWVKWVNPPTRSRQER